MRECRLVSYMGEWQVCSKARRMRDGELVVVWIYGKERLELCEVGKQDDVMVIPDSGPPDFHGDHFIHTIDVRPPFARYPETVGGANDPWAANEAFRMIVRNNPPTHEVTLRDRSRIMRRMNGRAVYQALIKRWVTGPDFDPDKI